MQPCIMIGQAGYGSGFSPPERRPAAEPEALCGPAVRLNQAASPPDRKGWANHVTSQKKAFQPVL